MGHNRTSPGVFRFRSHAAIVILACAALICLVPCAGAQRFGQLPDSFTAANRVMTGIDVYESLNPESFHGKRVGLITNQTGVDSRGQRTIDLIAKSPGVKLVALFSPEHGMDGKVDSAVPSSTDAATGIPVYSLYGDTRRPTDAMLQGIDMLIFDIQDAGVRFYTYVTTMAYCMEEAAKHHIEFVIFDRPDPLGGDVVEGPMLDADRTSFTAYFPMPVRFGMTIGELAQMFNAENHIGANLRVFPMRGWHRRETYDETGLTWIPPSPNLRSVNALLLYPGVEILQAGGISVGRNTEIPFELLGAPWIDANQLVKALRDRTIPGMSLIPAKFTPSDGLYGGELCHGVKLTITNRRSFRAMRMGLEIADALRRLYPEKFQLEKIIALLGSQSTIDRLKRGDAAADIVAGWSRDLEKFREKREKYLLYK
jgi:uncharacterized protein YbbC (DUF1343 family)